MIDFLIQDVMILVLFPPRQVNLKLNYNNKVWKDSKNESLTIDNKCQLNLIVTCINL